MRRAMSTIFSVATETRRTRRNLSPRKVRRMFSDRHAFTMIELIFVIVVLGILASVAVPRFFPVVEDAYIAKAQAKVSVIRSGLQNWRSLHLLKGDGGAYPSSIDDDSDASKLFCKVTTCETNGSAVGKWSKRATGSICFIWIRTISCSITTVRQEVSTACRHPTYVTASSKERYFCITTALPFWARSFLL